MDELTIRTGGSTLGGWQEVSVTRGVEICPSYFSVSLTERYPTTMGQEVVEPGSPCEVFLGADKVMTGYIDRYMPAYDKESHQVRIVGRSKTEDIVDCSVDIDAVGKEGWFFQSGKISVAARKICDPYKIEVKLPNDDPELPSGGRGYFHYDPGMPCYLLIEEMARSVGMLVWDDADGNLVISRGGTGGRAGSALVEGQNVEMAEALLSMAERYSRYLVVSQIPVIKSGHVDIFAHAEDPGVKRNRLLMILAEAPYDEQWAQIRADYEQSKRYGRSRQARITVTGWRSGDGKLWTPNMMVSAQLPRLKLNEDRVIASVTWSASERGRLTQMTLIEKQGLNPRPFAGRPPISMV